VTVATVDGVLVVASGGRPSRSDVTVMSVETIQLTDGPSVELLGISVTVGTAASPVVDSSPGLVGTGTPPKLDGASAGSSGVSGGASVGLSGGVSPVSEGPSARVADGASVGASDGAASAGVSAGVSDGASVGVSAGRSPVVSAGVSVDV